MQGNETKLLYIIGHFKAPTLTTAGSLHMLYIVCIVPQESL